MFCVCLYNNTYLSHDSFFSGDTTQSWTFISFSAERLTETARVLVALRRATEARVRAERENMFIFTR